MAMPLSMEFWLDGLVAVLLLVTVVYCLVLNRRLTALRGNQAEMRLLLADFTEATKQAEASVGNLKVMGDQIGLSLEQRMGEARALADELHTVTQSGARLADRIESGLVGRREGTEMPAAPGEAAGASGTLSESERELAEILRQSR